MTWHFSEWQFIEQPVSPFKKSSNSETNKAYSLRTTSRRDPIFMDVES
mgnify:CR=1 FL=1